MIKKFELGYAGPETRTLVKAARAAAFKNFELVYAGLACRNKSKRKNYASFRNTVVIPISDVDGNVVAFAHRTWIWGVEKFWLTTPQNTAFHKNKILFGLHQGKDEMQRVGFVFLVPDFIHIFQLHTLGVSNVICLCSDKFTEFHAEAIRMFCNRVVLIEDTSSTKVNKILKEVMIASALDVDVCSIDQLGQSLVVLKNAVEFNAIVSKNTSPYILKLTQEALKQEWSSREKKFYEIISLISKVKEDERRLEFINSFSTLTKLDKPKVTEMVIQKGREDRVVFNSKVARVLEMRKNGRGEFEILKFFFLPDAELKWLGGWQNIVDNIAGYKFRVYSLKHLYSSLQLLLSKGGSPTPEELGKISRWSSRVSRRFFEDANRFDWQPLEASADVRPEFVSLINNFKLEMIRRKIAYYQAREFELSFGRAELSKLRDIERILTQETL